MDRLPAVEAFEDCKQAAVLLDLGCNRKEIASPVIARQSRPRGKRRLCGFDCGVNFNLTAFDDASQSQSIPRIDRFEIALVDEPGKSTVDERVKIAPMRVQPLHGSVCFLR